MLKIPKKDRHYKEKITHKTSNGPQNTENYRLHVDNLPVTLVLRMLNNHQQVMDEETTKFHNKWNMYVVVCDTNISYWLIIIATVKLSSM
jgi:hypothetical protein